MLDKQKLRTFVLGGIAGALAGVLLAPRSGKELRGSISNRAGEARERGRETYFEAQERMQERFSEAREHTPKETGPDRESVVEKLPRLSSDIEEVSPDPPLLRDVSRDMPRPSPGEDPEELRRRIQETRLRLRARLGEGGAEDAPEDRDA
ncbi:MAG: YtxH domain-containing protein [Actinomycetota bacterium]|nr:YtxH domain-containing protein [Actinomycetota bacterium]